MKKYLFITVVGFASLSGIHAQDALTMQDINFDHVGYNTAFISHRDEPVAVYLTNTTGGGIQEAGQINFVGYGQVKKSGLALGARVNSKYFGLFRTSVVEVLTAKKIPLNGESFLMAGLGVGMQFSSLRTGELNSHVDRMDPMLVNGAFPQYRFVFGFGLGYSWRNKLHAGISMPTIARTESVFYPIYIANVSYNIVGGADFALEPEMLLFGSDIKPVSGELNTKLIYKEMFWVKMGGRTTRTFVGGIGVDTPFISVGYAYNGFMQEFGMVVPATHHINLSFRLAQDGDGKRKFQLW